MEKILLVEDDLSLRKIYTKFLSSKGFTVVSAEDGLEGMNMARNENPALIVLDVMLPKMNGYKVCKILKSDPRAKTIPIILHTAKMAQEDQLMSEQVGADAFIVKGDSLDALHTKITEIIFGKSEAEPG